MSFSMNSIKGLVITLLGITALAVVILFPLQSQATTAAAEDGAGTFKAKCAACHGADGSGNTPMGKKLRVRNLGSAGVQKQSNAQLAAVISKGKRKMPGFAKSLNGDQINQLVAHIRTLKK
jgi:mono/diheme cytochrome c family protein